MAPHYPYPAIGKLYFKADVQLQSPLLIGCGESENSDIDLIRDPETRKPFIPATSLVGVFRAFLEKHLNKKLKKDQVFQKQFNFLFGYLWTPEDKNIRDEKTRPVEAQSALQCRDILLKQAKVMIRDGVKIDPRDNTAEDKSKYNYEIIDNTPPFPLMLEVTLREDFDKAVFNTLLYAVFDGIARQEIRLGAKTSRGFGKITLDPKAVQYAHLDFENKKHVRQWLKNTPSYSAFHSVNPKPLQLREALFEITADFRIKSSMLIRSYSANPAKPDVVAIERNGNPVLPGTSLAGAIRHRSFKILSTLGFDNVDGKIKSLFGYEGSGDEDAPEDARQSRVHIEESEVDRNAVTKEVQSRIQIDRFTGGTILGALFDALPLWQKGNTQSITLRLKIRNATDWEKTLFLFVLKDLWTGDLPIGGEKSIGRGRLAGLAAEIKWGDGKTFHITADAQGRPAGDWRALQDLAKKLQEGKKHAA